MNDADREIVTEDGHTLGDVKRLGERARALGYVLDTDGRYREFKLRAAAGNWIDAQGNGPGLAAQPQAKVGGCTFGEIEAWLAAKEHAKRR